MAGNILLTDYLSSGQAIAWSSGQGLNSAVDDEYTNLSDEIDNRSTGWPVADIELYLASAAFTGDDSIIVVFIIPSVDGTNYPTWTGNVSTYEQENDNYVVGSVTTSGATAVQRMALRRVALPPGKFKFAFRNESGVTLASSGNTAKFSPYGTRYA